MPSNNRQAIRGLALGAGAAAALLIGVEAGRTAPVAGQSGQVNGPPAAAQAPAVSQPFSFANVVEKVAPAVVSIDITEKAPASRGASLGGLPFPFGGDSDGGRGSSRPQTVQATGSGFFISPDGYIVTNNHVAGDASTIKVRLADGRELNARLIGRDRGTDLAVIKVDGRNFPFVNFEDRARPRVGDWVIAIGNPYDLGGTATAGIVSAYNRDIGQQYVDYMQIDAPINRGNSGGPTFDVNGRVVGVNTAIFSPSGGSVGIGFAIPASLAQSVTRQLISSGKVARGYLGATVQDVTPDIANALGRPGLKGALIADVTPDGPAARAGLKAGDVVTRVNGAEVASNTALTRQVAGVQSGAVMHIEALRAGKPVTFDVRSGLRPSEEQMAKLGAAPQDGGDDQDDDGQG